MSRLRVLVAAPFGEGAVLSGLEGMEGVDLDYQPDLLPAQRFLADHAGDHAFARSDDQQRRWNAALANADIALGIPGDGPAGIRELLDLAPRLVWVQGTAAGTGEKVIGSGLPLAEIDRVAWTSTAGIHAQRLAEFALAGALYLVKDFDRLRSDQQARRWPSRWVMGTLQGARVAVVGAGSVGRKTADLFAAMGANVTVLGRVPRDVGTVVTWANIDRLVAVAGKSDIIVGALPGGEQTWNLISAPTFEAMPPESIFVNVGRGTTVDQAALTSALASGSVAGAVLDVTTPEPLPGDDELWALPNVLISPHTAALDPLEDERIVRLFRENLQRWLAGEPLLNRVDLGRGY
jgi:phosphoglycerate dehydrogenase-like enzyme